MQKEKNVISIVRGKEGILGKNTVVNLGSNRDRDYLADGILEIRNVKDIKKEKAGINYRKLIETFENGEWKVTNVGDWGSSVSVNFCDLENTSKDNMFSGCKMRIFADRLVKNKK